VPIKKIIDCKPQLVRSIERVDNLVLLGFLLDSSFSFQKHIRNLVGRAAKNIFLLTKLKRRGYSQREMDVLYNSFIFSILSYGCQVYASATNGSINEIDKLQKRALHQGLCSKYKPMMTFIQEQDQSLLQKIVKNGKHVLRKYMPKRPEACAKLRRKLPGCPKLKQASDFKVFPFRTLNCRL